jgi:hypothetical protein
MLSADPFALDGADNDTGFEIYPLSSHHLVARTVVLEGAFEAVSVIAPT